jgi:hypothetical protein
MTWAAARQRRLFPLSSGTSPPAAALSSTSGHGLGQPTVEVQPTRVSKNAGHDIAVLAAACAILAVADRLDAG